MKKLVFITLFVLQAFLGFAQKATGISGKVVDAKTQKPLQNVVASIANTNFSQLTNENGEFKFTNLAVGNQLLQIKTAGYKDQIFPIEVLAKQMLDIGTVVLEEDQAEERAVSLVTITENDLGDDNSGSESTSGILQSSRDAFQQAAAFNWGQARFKMRGLDSEYSTVMINGVIMNKLYDGRPQFGNWGGLNDATRNQEYSFGSSPSDYTFGGVLGTANINARASQYRKGNRISGSINNTNYTGRIMGTISSGARNDGWAYTISASRRFASQGYFEGTTYSANSFFASVEKKLSQSNSLNLTTIFAQNVRGKNSPNTDEVTALKGEKYNSYWGWQNGERRNSREKTLEEPVFILTDFWKISQKTNLNTTIAYQFGKIGNTRLTYQGADNPDPTYYRNLPSYETSLYDTNGNFTPDYDEAAKKKEAFLADGQLNWDGLVYSNTHSGDGHSYYTLYEDRTDDKLLSANTVLSSQLSDNILLNAGVTYRDLKSHNFQNMLDLLGGSYFRDVTLFGVGHDQQQSDLNNPDRIVKAGDTFGYDYNLTSKNIDAFTQFKFNYKKVDFYLAQSFSKAQYQREGLYKNGYYPTTSFGKSDKITFDNFGFKGGFTYKIKGNHFITINGAYMTKAPTLRNTYNNARINSSIVNGIKSESISTADISYIISRPKLKTRLTAYYSKIENQTETSFFFGDGAGVDDPTTTTNESNAFVAETVTGINKRNIGAEFGFEYPITSSIKVTAAAAYGEYIYDNNPNVYLNVDALANSANGTVINYGEAKLKNYHQSGMPQTAASFGLEYRDPHFWFIGANANYLANNYIDVAPITRTNRFYEDPATPGVSVSDATYARGAELLKQEKFKEVSLINMNGGKSWRIGTSTLGFFATVTNVLDVKYKTGGFEQARNSNYIQLNQDVSSGTPAFAPKYFYNYGRTYFVNLYLNF